MKKILSIFAVIVIALAIVGFSYATWFSSVFINGSVTLGTIDLQQYDFAVHNQTNPAATITHTWPDVHTLTITIDKAYPGWKGFLDITVINAGNLPLKFYSFQLTNWNDPTLASYFNLGFVTPSDTYNVGPTSLTYYATLHTYEGDWGIPAAAITLQPGATQLSRISIEVASNIPSAYQGATLSVTFELVGTLAI